MRSYMKKNILPLLMIPAFFMADADAYEMCDVDSCCKNYYAKIFSGPNFLQNTTIDENEATYDTGYIIAGSLGYYCNHGLRLEGEYAFIRNNIKHIDFFGQGSSTRGYFQSSSCMVNLLWDLPYCWGSSQPFIGGGLGYDFQHMHSSNSLIIFNQNWNNFSWQIMAGIASSICANTDMTLEYRFHGSGHFYNHSVGVGLVYKFDSFR